MIVASTSSVSSTGAASRVLRQPPPVQLPPRFHPPTPHPPQPVPQGVRRGQRFQPQPAQDLVLRPQLPYVFQPPSSRLQHPHQRLHVGAGPIPTPAPRLGKQLIHPPP